MRRLPLGNDEPSGSPVISRLLVNSVIALPSALVTMNRSCFSAVMLVIGKKMCEKNLTPFCNAQSFMACDDVGGRDVEWCAGLHRVVDRLLADFAATHGCFLLVGCVLVEFEGGTYRDRDAPNAGRQPVLTPFTRPPYARLVDMIQNQM